MKQARKKYLGQLRGAGEKSVGAALPSHHPPQLRRQAFHFPRVINTRMLRSPFRNQHIVGRTNDPVPKSDTGSTDRLNRCRYIEHVIKKRDRPVATVDFSNGKVNAFRFKLAVRLPQRSQEFNPPFFKPRQIGGMMRHTGLVGLRIAYAQGVGVGEAGLGTPDWGRRFFSL